MAEEKKLPPVMMLHVDKLDLLRDFITAEQMGNCMLALIDYFIDGVVPDLADRGTRKAFESLRQSVDDGKARYEEKLLHSEYAVYCRQEKAAGRTPLSFVEWGRG